MSRSNYDKPFFVDVGTSIAVVRCQSNRDVLDRFDHVRLGKAGIEMAEKMCDRMNAEVDMIVRQSEAYRRTAEDALKRLALFREVASCPSRVLERNCDRYINLSDARAAYRAFVYANREAGKDSTPPGFGEWLLQTASPDGDGYKRVAGVHTPEDREGGSK